MTNEDLKAVAELLKFYVEKVGEELGEHRSFDYDYDPTSRPDPYGICEIGCWGCNARGTEHQRPEAADPAPKEEPVPGYWGLRGSVWEQHIEHEPDCRFIKLKRFIEEYAPGESGGQCLQCSACGNLCISPAWALEQAQEVHARECPVLNPLHSGHSSHDDNEPN